MGIGGGVLNGIGGGGVSGGGEDFEKSIQYATEGQTIFTATFNINSVFVDSILVTTGYSGEGTTTITFDTGLSENQEVYLKST